MKILYLTFFESPTHNGIYESQVKGLLRKLAEDYGKELNIHHVAILPAILVGRKEFTSPFISERNELEAIKAEFEKSGVQVTFLFAPVAILKRWMSNPGLGLLFLTYVLCLPVLLYKIAREHFDVVHCRSYVATTFALGLKIFFWKTKIVFDPRGFYPEEGVVYGRWTVGSLTFRFWKYLEHILTHRSDIVVSLSETFTEHIMEIERGANCALVYAGAEIRCFKRLPKVREEKRKQLGLDHNFVFVYNGSLGSWHDPEMLARVFRVIRDGFPRSRLLVVTQYERRKLESLFLSLGLGEKDYIIVTAEPEEVPGYLMAGDLGIVPLREITQPGAMHVVAETMIGLKVAEYLASGLPIIVNQAVRGIQPLMENHKIGVFFDCRNLQEVLEGIQKIIDRYSDYQADCELVARRYLSLDEAVRLYHNLYAGLLKEPIRTGNGH